MREDDRSYYQRRAEVERDRAERATSPMVVQAHNRLAEAYLGKLQADRPMTAEGP